MAASKAVVPGRALRTSKRTDKSSPASTQSFMERLPSEILIKILSYLDASTLCCINHINKIFYQLANSNALWRKLYIADFSKNKKCMDKSLLRMATMEVQDRPEGYYKRLYFKTVAECDMIKWTRRLGLISIHTGLPSQTEWVLRNLNVTWELTVMGKSGRKSTLEQSRSQFTETSVTLCWSGGDRLPDYQQISTLQLYGVRRLACVSPKSPVCRSLMEKLDMQTLTKNMQVIGQDRLVQLKLLQPGIIIGVWRDQCSVAFIMFTLHFHKLVERSTQGSSVCSYVEPVVQPPFCDIDPEYGLHGYQLHIVLHNTISDGLIQLTVISSTNLSQHTSLSGDITLPWRCEALQGTVENCCIMSLTLLDEFRKPFKCVTSPVSAELERTPVCYDYDGEHYLIHYQDSDIQVKMRLVWMNEQKQFILISLVVYVSVCYVNKYFSRDY
ncbi:F-box only protein 15 isoform X2 [Pundamilia nyererei]|uniref:F-box only protein 15 isoform X2 n=1 Tax=Pundamilia nyererei TaxID=303518 RepID=A0A9Y6SQ83_9CICH|nr:PREDICTED: F-box only protein 15 isoform X2 [Pundamilia nyererei]